MGAENWTRIILPLLRLHAMQRLILLCLLNFTCFSGFAQLKIGHVNFETFLLEIPETKVVMAKVNHLGDSLNAMLAQKADFIRDMAKSPTQAITADSLDNLQNDFNAETYRCQTLISETYTKEIKIIQTKVKKAIAEIAAEQGFNYILDSSDKKVLFADSPTTDITIWLKQKLKLE